jgi:hypothetical protein
MAAAYTGHQLRLAPMATRARNVKVNRTQKDDGPAAGIAYVICPIGPSKSEVRTRADEIMDFIIEPAVRQFDLRPDRSDKEPSPGSITRQIVKSITEARVVIADLSLRNPNVFYELGVAHSFRRPVVLLIDDAGKLPFDVHHERVIELGSEGLVSLSDARRALGELIAALKVVLSANYEPASIVTDVARAQTVSQMESDDPSAARLERLSAELAYVTGRVRSVEAKLDRTAIFGPSFEIDHVYPGGSWATTGRTTALRAGEVDSLVVRGEAVPMNVKILNEDTTRPTVISSRADNRRAGDRSGKRERRPK